jgi:pyruvate dehydrogenase E1 component
VTSHETPRPIGINLPSHAQDPDPEETREWLDSFDGLVEQRGADRASEVMQSLIQHARDEDLHLPDSLTTDYVNTISEENQPEYPGDVELEKELRNINRWNAAMVVHRAQRPGVSVGGHLSSYASIATMYEVGFNHFFRGRNHPGGGDHVFFQGHASPGIYARAFAMGRLSQEDLDGFRQEVSSEHGMPSYPHPRAMQDFWEFPTVSMGIGPVNAIEQASFDRYLHHRGLKDTSEQHTWAFLGDGEMDEVESRGALHIAAKEHLDNLTFVVNCNLQRLDGPVRGNGKIIQELEGDFRGSGWNVIKLIWGGYWDPLLAHDKEGILRQIMEDTVDGEYQAYKANDGKFVREHFFGKHPKLLEAVSRMSDEDIWRLNRGGHDPHKVYAAFNAAATHAGQPTVILAKTIKGYGMGHVGQAKNPTHQQKKLELDSIREFRDRFGIPIPDDKLADLPYFKPADDSPEMKYLHERRAALGGYLPHRRQKADEHLKAPALDAFKAVLEPTAEGREISTTQAFVRILNQVLRDKELGPRVVPILADESRTFGMEGLFRQIGIYAPEGQKYTPVDKDQVMYYKESADGQLLQEGINEAGAMSSWIAAATSYSSNNRIMIPFFIYYSMFGFQRIGDLAWAAGDMQARGFLLGGTAGRTTLNGEGLQHEDGHSHILASTIPNCVSYDPTFGHELAVIVQHGLKRMVEDQENVYYYLTVMNENYPQPGLTQGDEEGIIKGMYKLKSHGKGKNRVQLMGSGTILREVMAAQELLEADWGVASDLWSVTSFTELRRNGLDAERHNMLHPDEKKPQVAYVTEQLAKTEGPIIASTDYMKLFADQIRPFVPKGREYKVLGTDGFGRSDFRSKLREHFEVDRHFVVVAALRALADEGKVPVAKVAEAIKKYGINPNKANPQYA